MWLAGCRERSKWGIVRWYIRAMRIALVGQSAFGEAVLRALVEQGEEVVGVLCPPDREGRPFDPLKSAAVELGIAVLQFRRMRDAQAIEAFRELSADLGVMAYVTDIVPQEILEAPTHGTIQYHPSLLPLHRGPSSINWAVIQGDRETGLSIFWPDSGLDTGPILLQKRVEIGPDDTTGSLYFDKLFPLGVSAMVEAIGLVATGQAPRIEQDHSSATYEGWCKAAEARIDWGMDARALYNLVRGADPSPGAWTTFGESGLALFRASMQPGDHGRPEGEVIAMDETAITIAARGGSLVVGRVRPEGGRKVEAAVWAGKVGLAEGDRFGE